MSSPVGRDSDSDPHTMTRSSRPCLSFSLILAVSGLSMLASVLAVRLSQSDTQGDHVSLMSFRARYNVIFSSP